ncbi:right-handed parallel beta-helix repeat-containing protein [Planomicrobium okeanokoites]|uniref:Right-handed parallel beta-helix repeat-containing protein n=1 Tax=Planomicrobium okeanokoites TaxID=244 RepID=A0ABV7KTX6_PLAOK|nr:right-handed parallel beta-helix repeat-containing protein [Planomicrobium okeanokoites]TAA71587.1 hypothetical protein D2910_04730 [Planomicrobium okeanokoites]
MNHDIEITQLDLVEGGNVIRQGHHFTLGFTPRGENGDVVALTGKDIYAVFYDKNGIRYEGTAEYVADDAVIRVTITENIGHGTMWIEFTATDPNDATYKRKFPARENNARISVTPSTDDLGFVGVKSITVTQLRAEQEAKQQEFEATVIPQVDDISTRQLQLESDYQEAVAGVTVDSEVILARGGEPTLGAHLNKVNQQLAEKAAAADIEGRGINADNFPVIAPEVGEEGRIQRAIDYAVTNGVQRVILPAKIRQVRGAVTLKSGVTLVAFNNKLINKETHITFLKMESKTKLYGIEIEGKDHIVPNVAGRGISIEGANASAYTEDIMINDVFIHDIGYYGIYTSFAKNVYVDKAKMRGLGRAGFMSLSPDNVNIEHSIIKDVTTESGNGYGVAFTRQSFESLTDYPLPKDCVAFNVIVEDVPWEGFDTHAGQGVRFINNTVRNCKVGIAVVAANLTGSIDYASNDCLVDGNLIFGGNSGVAISIAGAGGAIGAPKEYAKGCIVSGNRIWGGGIAGNNNSGSIYLVATEGVVVIGNSIERANESGIILYNTNIGFMVDGNTITDVLSNTYSLAPCINVRSDYNKGTIGKNNAMRKTPSLANYVSEWAINIGSGVNNEVTIDLGYSTCTNDILGGSGQNHSYGTLGGSSLIHRGTASPEGVITASIGSIFINANGGAGTTLWVKQTGSGNTGWVGK